MNRFASRYAGTELIDSPGIPFSDWEVCLKELNSVNTLLGGHSITVEGVKKLINGKLSGVTIAEIGCGGGDNLKAINKWYKKNSFKFIGIDINKACIDFAERNCKEISDAHFICSDYKQVNFKGNKPDIIFSSLFSHHFTNEQLVEMLIWLKNNSRMGFFINDLQRHPVAYYSIKFLTKIFSRSYLVKNDGPISVMRGFSKTEWVDLLNKAGIKNYTISWRWAFRYLITVPDA
jgi:2-polyprenyl-3-methyl-5-hydroxy-6-metoxy-1,4-benzoquinol methylase